MDIRREVVRHLINELRCTTASGLARRLGLSHTQAAYTLRTLEKMGVVVKYDVGSTHVWCIPDTSEAEAYTTVSPCFKYAEEAFRRIIHSARGRVLTLTPRDLLRALARRDGRCTPNAFLYRTARAWLERHLDGSASIKRRGVREVEYIIDVKKAREKLIAVP